ncbi:alpha-amylase family glycosyl hydrolase [Arsenicibacter rosenii]|uniref:Alpha-amylase n=1 Tax=Arsenicibacter rosenii TaxID=1750698 RepID=A0A1S2VSL9_9BACT|nr:alpha-amylase family glycosyl hydrolase [Arsenicibacter rosenii]OIN60918.1 alpha-amylase [Arsenicibacter rosenii]
MNTTSPVATMDKLVIYQIFTRLFGNNNTTNKAWGSRDENGVGKFNDITDKALQELKQFGVSHVWYTGVIEHAIQTDYTANGIPPDDPAVVKGKAGSPYAIKDYYDINPDLAVEVPNRMAEFEALVRRTKANRLKVIIDFIPNHVARQYHSDVKPAGVIDLGQQDDQTVGFKRDNNFYYLVGQQLQIPAGVVTSDGTPVHAPKLKEFPAKVTGNDAVTASPSINDWYETVKLNYGVDIFDHGKTYFDPVPATWQQMLDILLYWAGKGVDGFRCDMAQMVPVEFWEWAIQRVKAAHPGIIFIAEIYEVDKYRPYIFKGGFDYLYDKVGLYDALRRLMEGQGTCRDITKVWQQESGDYSGHMLRFLENHDEQRIASRFFANDPWVAVPAMTLSATLHTGPVMLYFGQEVGVRAEGSEGFSGDDGRTTIFDYWGVKEWQGWINRKGNAAGRFDGAGLTADQKKLRAFYQQLNHLVNGSDAIQHGKFYDLQWANGRTAGYNQDRQYAYLRHTDKQKLLIVCNFDKTQPCQTRLHLPDHAWQTIGLEAKRPHQFTDIFLTNIRLETQSGEDIALELPPLGVLVLEIH